MRAFLAPIRASWLIAFLVVAQGCASEVELPDPAYGEDGGGIEVASTSQALTGCVDASYGGHTYRHCAGPLNWTEARDTCRGYGFDLVSIENTPENSFVGQLGSAPMWIGANDLAVETNWKWSAGDVPFLTSATPPGTPVSKRYENFPSTEPVANGAAIDCASLRPASARQWYSQVCTDRMAYVCETVDACPADPNKTAPGVCGCSIADADGDGDGVANCIDGCPRDAQKTEPKMAGCGVPETDSDGDTVPDAVDDEPNDSTSQNEDTCGTPSAPAPAGTQCGDAPCLGVFTCNGAGRCGATNSCPMPPNGGNCVYRELHEKGYWFCPSGLSWDAANLACRTIKGGHLVEIESSAENALVAANIAADAWTGANDVALEGRFRSTNYTTNNGQRLWDGAATGAPYYARYTKWTSGQPGGGATEDCVAIVGSGSTRGQWDDRVCTQSRGFVCEVPGPRLRITNLPGPIGPTLTETHGLPTTPATSYTNCVSEYFAFGDPTLRGRARYETDRCHECTKRLPLNNCLSECQGVASVPPLNSRCSPWTSTETSFCKLKAPYLVPQTQLPIPCETDEQCQDHDEIPDAQQRCGYWASVPLSGGKKGADRICGTPDDRCPDTNPNNADPIRCSEQTLCEVQYKQTTNTLAGPGSDLAAGPLTADATFGFEGDPAPPAPYADQSDPCSGAACNLNEEHPWCDFSVNDSAIWTDKSFSGNGTGRSGDNHNQGLISFYFDPKMQLTFNPRIGPMGLPKLELKAEAGIKAGVDIGPLLVDLPKFDVIDALIAVDGSECFINADRTFVRIMEQDFVPPRSMPSIGPDDRTMYDCQYLHDQVTDSVDRANKALRDAAYLIRSYKTLAANGPVGNLCQQIAANPPRGFPPSANCATESPEATIKRFVDYYRSTVSGFDASAQMKGMAQAAQQLADFSRGTNLGKFSDTIALFEDFEPETEEATILSVPFFIGPIPCNIEIYASLTYGVTSSLTWQLNPGGVVNDMLFAKNGSTQSNVASVQIEGAPMASAGLGAFAGVGFDVGAASAKLGVDARLTIGTIEVPAFAKAGLNIGSELDTRALPADLDLMSSWPMTVDNLVPAKRYSISLTYGAGLSARLTNVLAGDVSAKLKLKFFFFSKSWSKRLFGFTGLCPEDEACEYSLVSVNGSTEVAALDDHQWNKIAMPSPLPALMAPFGWGPVPTTSTPVSTAPVEEFFFDSLCTCIKDRTDQKSGLERACVRADDCCPETPRCFDDPARSSFSSRTVCSTACRRANASCRVNSDCCDHTTTMRCANVPEAVYPRCIPRSACGQSCTSDDHCRNQSPALRCITNGTVGICLRKDGIICGS